jgi:hypothetical protein
VELYTVVAALTVAEAKYNAALKLSTVEAARMGATPKLWVAVINSPINEVHIAWVLAMIFPYAMEAASASAEVAGCFKLT